MRLMKQRGALTVETMSAMTVMDKSIKSSAHVKCPTEKDRPRGAGLNLVASRGTWVSGILGVWNSDPKVAGALAMACFVCIMTGLLGKAGLRVKL